MFRREKAADTRPRREQYGGQAKGPIVRRRRRATGNKPKDKAKSTKDKTNSTKDKAKSTKDKPEARIVPANLRSRLSPLHKRPPPQASSSSTTPAPCPVAPALQRDRHVSRVAPPPSSHMPPPPVLYQPASVQPKPLSPAPLHLSSDPPIPPFAQTMVDYWHPALLRLKRSWGLRPGKPPRDLALAFQLLDNHPAWICASGKCWC